MKEIIFLTASLMMMLMSCDNEKSSSQSIETEGYNMLLIGNSFFRPYAEKLDEMAIEANFLDHKSTIVIRGGENGRAINFWNDSTSEEHVLIKSKLDQGDVNFFGMTSGFFFFMSFKELYFELLLIEILFSHLFFQLMKFLLI